MLQIKQKAEQNLQSHSRQNEEEEKQNFFSCHQSVYWYVPYIYRATHLSREQFPLLLFFSLFALQSNYKRDVFVYM